MTDRKQVKSEMIERLLEGVGQKVPTSSLRRLGSMGWSALRAARMVRRSSKARTEGGELELDAEQLARLITSIGRLKGVAMKMGQIMSYIDMAVPKQLQDALSVLQTHAQPMGFDVVRAVVTEELGARANWYRLEKSYVDDFAAAHPLLSG